MFFKLLSPLFVPTMVVAFSIAYYMESWEVTSNNKLLIKPICFLIVLLYIYFIYQEYTKQKLEIKQEKSSNVERTAISSHQIMLSKSVIIVVMTGIYVLLIQYLGFIITSIMFMGGMLYTLNVKNKWIIAIYSVLSTIILYFAFKIILMVPLPTGILSI